MTDRKSHKTVLTKYVRPHMKEILQTTRLKNAELAKAIGISEPMIYKILGSEDEPEARTRTSILNAIAEYMNCYVLFTGEKPVLVPRSLNDTPDGRYSEEQLEAILENTNPSDRTIKILHKALIAHEEALGIRDVDKKDKR